MTSGIYSVIGALFCILAIYQCSSEKNWDLLYLLKTERHIRLTDDFTLKLGSWTNYSQMFLSAKRIFTDNTRSDTFIAYVHLKLTKLLNKPVTLLSFKDPDHTIRFQMSFKTSPGIIEKLELNVMFNPNSSGESSNYDFILPFRPTEAWLFALLITSDKIVLYSTCDDTRRLYGYQSFNFGKVMEKLFFKDGAIVQLFNDEFQGNTLEGEIYELSFSNDIRKLGDLCFQSNIEGSGNKKLNFGKSVPGNMLLKTEQMNDEEEAPPTSSVTISPSDYQESLTKKPDVDSTKLSKEELIKLEMSKLISLEYYGTSSTKLTESKQTTSIPNDNTNQNNFINNKSEKKQTDKTSQPVTKSSKYNANINKHTSSSPKEKLPSNFFTKPSSVKQDQKIVKIKLKSLLSTSINPKTPKTMADTSTAIGDSNKTLTMTTNIENTTQAANLNDNESTIEKHWTDSSKGTIRRKAFINGITEEPRKMITSKQRYIDLRTFETISSNIERSTQTTTEASSISTSPIISSSVDIKKDLAKASNAIPVITKQTNSSINAQSNVNSENKERQIIANTSEVFHIDQNRKSNALDSVESQSTRSSNSDIRNESNKMPFNTKRFHDDRPNVTPSSSTMSTTNTPHTVISQSGEDNNIDNFESFTNNTEEVLINERIVEGSQSTKSISNGIRKEFNKSQQVQVDDENCEGECKVMSQLRLTTPQQGEPGGRGQKGEVGMKGDTGSPGLDAQCDVEACKLQNMVKGDRGDPGYCSDKICQASKGERGLTGPKGDNGLKGDKGETSAMDVELIRHLAMSIIASELESRNIFKNNKGEKGSSGSCKCDSKKTPDVSSVDRLEESINIGYGSLVFENKDALEKVSSRLPTGSMVYILNSDAFLIKISQVNNIWRTISLDSRSKDWILPYPMNTPKYEITPAYQNGFGKKLHLIALAMPPMGDLKPMIRQPGGYSGAVFQCQQAGAIHGFGRSMHPLINTDTFKIKNVVNKKFRLIPIFNARGEIIFNDFYGLLSENEIIQNDILDFRRNSIFDNMISPCIWIGKEPKEYEINSQATCLNWMSRHPAVSGLVSMAIPQKPLFNENSKVLRSCSQQCYILCIQTEPYELS